MAGKTAKPPARAKTAQTAEADRPKSPSEWAYDRLVLYIRNFESQLDGEHEIAMGFAGGEAGVLRIEGLGYYEPDIITFFGRDEDGLKTQLIQHVSQMSVLLRAVPKQTPEEPPRRIGFRLQPGWLGGESGDGSAWPPMAKLPRDSGR
jgi:hypothetical protein